ncbi:RNB domain-containing ribonuclease [Ornithinimicrobium cryptoxanthini]|uniref:RNB domain-containing ribonuclease n=1 Tax=Ornithinimicrobium cryptoxanthini TaxID=2934161 RepID=A0ABY4YEG2_9MICO|nr:RNB domain-containing ribonuclease [Ornithinimicrobium cryptoxanthini]USQ75044.1 RNB domain-containing ribonuclease [Ornithinimicrobium cryptoxanthini]
MAQRATRIRDHRETQDETALEEAFADIRAKLEVRDEFPEAALAEARTAAKNPALPERDETAIAFLTIDPPGSMDLDQAMHIERVGEGYRIRYAIADVPAFVEPGGALDTEVRLRGQTIYCPDTRVPLHPTEISEGAASLLPDTERPAYVWDMRLTPEGVRESAELYRAMVRSVRRYTYEEAQGLVDRGEAEETLLLLKEVGEHRIRRESERGGASLPMPEQEVHVDDDGRYSLQFRPLLPVEDWNAQISLLTGMVAAQIMLDGKVGILRTMPAAQQRDVDRFRRQVRALGVTWPKGMAYGDFLRTLDREDPKHLAIIHDATALFRGASYAAFDGSVPEQTEQAAIAAPYTHVTAPLRRLIDRFVLVVCEALTQGREIPGWVREALPTLPEIMDDSGRLAKAVERACTDATEAAVLAHRVGEEFDAVVVDDAGKRGLQVQLTEPAVNALAQGSAELAEEVRVELVEAEIATQQVRFRIV